MKYKISIVLLVVLFSFLMFGTVSASQALMQGNALNFPAGTTIFVDVNNSSGIEDGTLANPFNTIQEGINIAVGGDLVGVAPGTYYEHVILNAGVQLVGTEPTSTIIDGSGSGTVVTMEDMSLLKGFTIQHGRASFGAGIVTRGSPKITNNIIRNNAQDGGGAGAAIHGNVSSPIIIGNLITENTADGQYLSGAISFINASSPYIVNNIIWNNVGLGAVNLTLPAGNSPVIMNNTILNNAGGGIRIDTRVDQSTVIVANNILFGNRIGILLDFGTSANWPTFEYNDVFGNISNYIGMSEMTGINGNVSVDPALSDDFHLTPGSPLIDIGSLNYYAISDFDGEPRPLDGNADGVAISDIGADEQPLIDEIPPVVNVEAIKEDGTIYVAGTWTNQTVTVKFTCHDLGSGVASCPAEQVFSTDGITPLITATATDNVGNEATITFGPIQVDKTPPMLFIAVSPNPVLLNGNATLLTNAADQLSGIDPGSMPCFNIDTSTVGVRSTRCYVSDNAGNQTTTTTEYRVIYDFVGFLQPVIDCVNNPCDPYQLSSFTVGNPISLKFQLKDADGNLVQSAIGPLWLVPIKITSTPPVIFPDDYVFQTSNSPYEWKKNQNNYVYTWNTKGLARHTNWLVGVKLDDGKTYYVFVALR